jgi:hypothetical protein
MIAQLAGEADVTVKNNVVENSKSNLDKRVNRIKGQQIHDQCKEMIRRLLGQKVLCSDKA